MASLLAKKLSPLLRSSSHHHSSLLSPLLRLLSSQPHRIPFASSSHPLSSHRALTLSTFSNLPPIMPDAPQTTFSKAPPARPDAPPTAFSNAPPTMPGVPPTTFPNAPPTMPDAAPSAFFGPNRSGLTGGYRSTMDFVQSILAEDDEMSARKKKHNFVHFTLSRKKTFVTVTDVNGNKKTGASSGVLGSEDRKGRGRQSRYAAEATAEYVGRAAKKIGIKSVVMKVKGTVFFNKKKKVIMSWRDGYRGEGVREKTNIVAIHDVTQLPHNGCRLPKKRRV